MTCLSALSDLPTLASFPLQRTRRRTSMRALGSVARAGALCLALANLTVPDAVIHAKWFKLGLILDSAHRHYAAQN